MAIETILVGDVEEKSSAIATLAFTDEAGDPFTPDAVYVAIDCVTTGTNIRAEAQVTPEASTMNVAIAHAENAIHDTDEPFDIHEITVRATYDGTSQMTGSARFKVKNLSFLS
jgi:hypothetical protein